VALLRLRQTLSLSQQKHVCRFFIVFGEIEVQDLNIHIYCQWRDNKIPCELIHSINHHDAKKGEMEYHKTSVAYCFEDTPV